MKTQLSKVSKTCLILYQISLIVLFFFISCEENATEPESIQQDYLARDIPDDAIPGVAYLGCGYNAFGEYASTISIRFPIIDFKSIQPLRLETNPMTYPKKYSISI
jgi:hypothetical protein